MSAIQRNPAAAASSKYDLIIIGGGIYGAMLSLEAGLRNLRSLLLERDDFGGATSYNSLRIVHGGFRYLQSFDLRRFYESVGERRWFLQTFPDLVKPLPCLMPLYSEGIKRPAILAGALSVNDLLSYHRNQGVRADRQLPSGEIISPKEVINRFPQVDRRELKGGAVWFDASMPDSQRVMMRVLRWASELGSVTLNYTEAESLLIEQGQVAGVRARDEIANTSYQYRATVVVNAAGPWSQKLAEQFDKSLGSTETSVAAPIFKPSLAWNILFDREALSDHALAIAPKKPKAQTYFLHPWKGRLLAGTIHNPWHESVDTRPQPLESEIENFINDLNLAIPDLNLERSEVTRILAGVLPVKQMGGIELASREIIWNHGGQGGLKGLYSIAGVKFTTSRLVADRTLNAIFPTCKKIVTEKIVPLKDMIKQGQFDYDFDYDWLPGKDSAWLQSLQKIITEEAVIHLDDLMLRRTSLGDNPQRALTCGREICTLLVKNEQQQQVELARLAAIYTNTN